MRIATRLWIALLATIGLVLGTGVLLRVPQERRQMLDVTTLDREFLGRALQSALLRPGAHPEQDARAMLERQGATRGNTELRLVSATHAHGLPPPRLTPTELASLDQSDVVVSQADGAIATFIPLEPRGALALEIVEPHEQSSVFQHIDWASLIVQTLALATLAGVLTFGLVRQWVGRPLEQLALLSRRIAAGDLSARTRTRKGLDEVVLLENEMNKMAEHLEETRRALEAADSERIGVLEKLRHADRLRTVGQLASAIAHEMGTPLNVISGHARLIEQDTTGSSQASARMVIEQAARLTSLIRDLLGFARSRARERKIVDLAALVDHANAMLAPLTRRNRIRVEVDHASGGVRVNADPQQLLQMLTNLMVNGIQAMSEGGTLHLDVAQVSVTPPSGLHSESGRFARLRVADEGKGIAVADMSHLFEPFFTRDSSGEGTGLGLAVVAGIVREHQGWIRADSEPGHGAKFEVFLPCEAD